MPPAVSASPPPPDVRHVKSERELIQMERAAARIRIARALDGVKESAPALLNPIPWVRRYPWASVGVIVAAAGAGAFWIWRIVSSHKITARDLRHDPVARRQFKRPPHRAGWFGRMRTSILRRARNTLFTTLFARFLWGQTGHAPEDYATADPYARWA